MTPSLRAPQPPAATEIAATDDEGRRYREGVYRPLPESELPEAPDAPPFPRRGRGPAYRVWNEVPRVPRLTHLVGPSIIALGMGLGAGEFLLWPNLITVNGYQIWWLFWVGVVTQFVVIHEIERWTIATGESIFAGMARLDRFAFWPWFFLAATLISFFWPGWASQSGEFTAEIVSSVTGRTIAWQPLALLMLVIIWIGLAGSTIVYNALERFEIYLVLGFFPLLLVALLVAGVIPADLMALLGGAVSFGRAPPALLTGAQFPTLLVAVAYAGSGGTLLLVQSLWLRDKGFGMATYQGRIAGIRGQNEDVSATGYVFDPRAEPAALSRFLSWMRVARNELLATFVLLIILSVVITSMLVTATLGVGNAELAGDLSGMVALQGDRLEEIAGTWLKVAFLLGGTLVLFSTQVAIVDTVTRIAGTIFYERYGRRTSFWTLKRTFLFFLTVLIAASMGIVLVSWTGGAGVDALQPNFLVLIAGPFTIASMYAFTLVVGYLNTRLLPAELAPSLLKKLGMGWAVILWGWFTMEQISRVILDRTGAPPEVIGQIVWHPVRLVLYGLWVLSLLWFTVAVIAKRGRSA